MVKEFDLVPIIISIKLLKRKYPIVRHMISKKNFTTNVHVKSENVLVVLVYTMVMPYY